MVNAFPAVSEVFLFNELRALEAQGLPLLILPLDNREVPDVHQIQAGIAGPVVHVPSGIPGRFALLWANTVVASRQPLRYLDLLRNAVANQRACEKTGRESQARRLQRRLRRLLLTGWLAYAARQSGVVHLHAFFADTPLDLTRAAAGLAGISYSFAAHAKDLYTTSPSRLRRGLSQARFVVTCHRHGYQLLRDFAGRRARRVIFQPHGTDLALFGPYSDSEREPGLVLAVGRLTPKKGFDDLIAACIRLKDTGTACRCVIVGDGRLRRELQAMIDAGGVARMVKIVGFQSQQQLAGWYRRASLLVVPSRVLPDGNRDGIPNVMIEAMCSGTPVVATSAGSIPEVIEDGVNGMLVSPNQPARLAAAIARMLGSPADARRIGMAASASIADLDYSRCAAPLVKKFAAILAGKGRVGTGAPTAAGNAKAPTLAS